MLLSFLSLWPEHKIPDTPKVGVKTLYIEPGSPWENGYNESFNSKLRDEMLNTEILYTLKEAKVLIERWRQHYNTIRPHSSLGYRPPAPETVLPPTHVPAYVLEGFGRNVKPRQSLT
jgi:transposase InsO family protein